MNEKEVCNYIDVSYVVFDKRKWKKIKRRKKEDKKEKVYVLDYECRGNEWYEHRKKIQI